MSDGPPEHLIQHAVIAARMSPCEKSKRGAVIFDEDRQMVSYGCNHPPGTLRCDGTSACRESCAKFCLHAEDEAIRKLPTRFSHAKTFKGIHSLVWDGGHQLEMVHVKIVSGEVVAGGKPSCWQCSRLCYEYGIAVWLYEAQRWHDELTCHVCRRITVIEQDKGTTGVCTQCDHVGRLLELPGKRVFDQASGIWRFYSPRAFHEHTAITCGIYGTGASVQ